jgi:hydrogenase maturation protease
MDARPPALVIGYGNPLRCDDGVGWHVAGSLARELPPRHVRVLALHQLTPELAEAVSEVERVVFVDASCAAAPGVVEVREVSLEDSPQSGFTHHYDPAALLRLSRKVYGRVPERAWIATVGGARFGCSVELSPRVAAAVPRVVEAVAELLGVGEGAGSRG